MKLTETSHEAREQRFPRENDRRACTVCRSQAASVRAERRLASRAQGQKQRRPLDHRALDARNWILTTRDAKQDDSADEAAATTPSDVLTQLENSGLESIDGTDAVHAM